MSIIVAALLGFVILSCIASSKSLIGVIALAALFYVSLPAFIGLLMIMGGDFLLFQMKGVSPCTSTTC